QRYGGPQPPGVGDEREHRPQEHPVRPPARRLTLQLRPDLLQQMVVLHAGRAGRHARHAAQAGVEVLPQLRRRDRPWFVAGPHQHDPAPRRVHLGAEDGVRGTGGQTESTVDAVLDELGVGRVVRVPRRGDRQRVHVHQASTVDRGRAGKRPAGSKRSLTRRFSAATPGSTDGQTWSTRRAPSVTVPAKGFSASRRPGTSLGEQRIQDRPSPARDTTEAPTSRAAPITRDRSPGCPETFSTTPSRLRWPSRWTCHSASSSFSTRTSVSPSCCSTGPSAAAWVAADAPPNRTSSPPASPFHRASDDSASSGRRFSSNAAVCSTVTSTVEPLTVTVARGSGCSRTA